MDDSLLFWILLQEGGGVKEGRRTADGGRQDRPQTADGGRQNGRWTVVGQAFEAGGANRQRIGNESTNVDGEPRAAQHGFPARRERKTFVPS